MLTTSRTIGRAAAVAVALIAGGIVVGGSPSGAAVEQTVSVSPTTVSDGTVIHISGTGCLDPDTGTSDGLEVGIVGEHLAYPNSDNMDGDIQRLATLASDGTFAEDVTVDTREDYFGPYPDFETVLHVACLKGGDIIGSYPDTAISYVGQVPPTTSTTAPPTVSSTTSTTAVPAGTAAPAAPVAGDPSFTG